MRNSHRITLILLVAAWSAGAAAQTPRDTLVVNTVWLAQHLSDPNLVLLHMGDPAEYTAKHIAGSRLVARADIAAAAAPGTLTLELPPPDDLKTKLEALGISDNSRIVVVFGKDWVSPATRVVFTLQAAGLGGQTSFLDGGLAAWERDGRPVTADVPAPRTGRLSVLKTDPLVVDADFVKSHLTTPGFAIVDARDPGYYNGTQTGGSQSAPHKTGHIAGAKSVPYASLVNADNMLKSPAALQSLFDQAGVKQGDTVVTYCHIGQQASAVLFAARTLGFNVKLYDGSFEDWSKKDGAVEKPIK